MQLAVQMIATFPHQSDRFANPEQFEKLLLSLGFSKIGRCRYVVMIFFLVFVKFKNAIENLKIEMASQNRR